MATLSPEDSDHLNKLQDVLPPGVIAFMVDVFLVNPPAGAGAATSFVVDWLHAISNGLQDTSAATVMHTARSLARVMELTSPNHAAAFWRDASAHPGAVGVEYLPL